MVRLRWAHTRYCATQSREPLTQPEAGPLPGGHPWPEVLERACTCLGLPWGPCWTQDGRCQQIGPAACPAGPPGCTARRTSAEAAGALAAVCGLRWTSVKARPPAQCQRQDGAALGASWLWVHSCSCPEPGEGAWMQERARWGLSGVLGQAWWSQGGRAGCGGGAAPREPPFHHPCPRPGLCEPRWAGAHTGLLTCATLRPAGTSPPPGEGTLPLTAHPPLLGDPGPMEGWGAVRGRGASEATVASRRHCSGWPVLCWRRALG